MKKVGVYTAFIVLAAYLALTLSGICGVGTDMQGHGDDSGMVHSPVCALAGTSASGDMTPLEHINHFRNLLASVSPASLLVFVVVFLAVLFFKNFSGEKTFLEFIQSVFALYKPPSRFQTAEISRETNPVLRSYTKQHPRLYE